MGKYSADEATCTMDTHHHGNWTVGAGRRSRPTHLHETPPEFDIGSARSDVSDVAVRGSFRGPNGVRRTANRTCGEPNRPSNAAFRHSGLSAAEFGRGERAGSPVGKICR